MFGTTVDWYYRIEFEYVIRIRGYIIAKYYWGDLCSLLFNYKMALKKEENIHEGLKRFKCTLVNQLI